MSGTVLGSGSGAGNREPRRKEVPIFIKLTVGERENRQDKYKKCIAWHTAWITMEEKQTVPGMGDQGSWIPFPLPPFTPATKTELILKMPNLVLPQGPCTCYSCCLECFCQNSWPDSHFPIQSQLTCHLLREAFPAYSRDKASPHDHFCPLSLL